jgi:DNA polymerase III epsilon subunit-like protein
MSDFHSADSDDAWARHPKAGVKQEPGGAPVARIPTLLRDRSFAAIDIETTGFSPLHGDRIVEVAAVPLFPDATQEST